MFLVNSHYNTGAVMVTLAMIILGAEGEPGIGGQFSHLGDGRFFPPPALAKFQRRGDLFRPRLGLTVGGFAHLVLCCSEWS